MKKKLIFGSMFVLSAYLVLLVGCNPTTNTQMPKDMKNKVEGAKQEKASDMKKQMDENVDKAMKGGKSETSQSSTEKATITPDQNVSISTETADKKVEETKKEITSKGEELNKQNSSGGV